MGLKALSLSQPYASLIAHGAKTIESRSWFTPYRGELAIHASRSFPIDERNRCLRGYFRDCLIHARYVDEYGDVDLKAIELGAIVAVVRLVGISRTEDVGRLDPREAAFGNYRPGRYAWHLELLYRVEPAHPCRGSLGLWEVPADGPLAVRREGVRA